MLSTVSIVGGLQWRFHAVCYEAGAKFARYRTVGEPYDAFALVQLLEIYERRRDRLVEHDQIANIRRVRERRSALDFARLVARTLFQCEMLILPL